jgi:hypothetical protein
LKGIGLQSSTTGRPLAFLYTLALASVGVFFVCADSAGMRARRASSGSRKYRRRDAFELFVQLGKITIGIEG